MAKTNYDDAFRNVMQYVKMRLDHDGTKIKIRDKEDLRFLFKKLDEKRRDQQESNKMSDSFIDGLLGTRAADRAAGMTIGKFGRTVTLRRAVKKKFTARQLTMPEQERIQRYRQEGRELYMSRKQEVIVKSPTRRKYGGVTNRFREITTGRFRSAKDIQSDI